VPCCYLRYSLSLRDVEELFAERGSEADHTNIRRWVQRYGPEPEQRPRFHLKLTNKSWRVHETYTVRTKGRWYCLSQAIDSAGETIDFLLSAMPQRPEWTEVDGRTVSSSAESKAESEFVLKNTKRATGLDNIYARRRMKTSVSRPRVQFSKLRTSQIMAVCLFPGVWHSPHSVLQAAITFLSGGGMRLGYF
jgi:transposase, IS6 family